MRRITLITGAAAGIGSATAQAFAAAGDRVLVADIDGARAAARARELGAGHEAIPVDMADPVGIAAIIAGIAAHHAHQLDELLPWNWRGVGEPRSVAA